jgi:hypothetical protein
MVAVLRRAAALEAAHCARTPEEEGLARQVAAVAGGF